MEMPDPTIIENERRGRRNQATPCGWHRIHQTPTGNGGWKCYGAWRFKISRIWARGNGTPNRNGSVAMNDIDSILLLRLIQMEVPTMTRKAMQEKYAEAIKEMFIATGDDIDVCFDKPRLHHEEPWQSQGRRLRRNPRRVWLRCFRQGLHGARRQSVTRTVGPSGPAPSGGNYDYQRTVYSFIRHRNGQ